ncbi:hypothetical protein ACYF6T_08525 [Streptomyces sp. 7R007]
MYIRIITETKQASRLVYEAERPRDRQSAPQAPWLGLAGVDEDHPAESHIVRGID